METFRQTSKNDMAIIDTYKAYDSIDQAKLNNIMLAHMPMSKLNELLIKHNNSQIEDKYINRTSRVLQGAKWDPITFNPYLDKPIKRHSKYDLTYSYICSASNSNKEEQQEYLQKMNQDIEQASLRWCEQWKMNHVLYENTKEVDVKNRKLSTTKDNKDANPISKETGTEVIHSLKTNKEETTQINEKKVSDINDLTPHLSSNKDKNYAKQRSLSKYKNIDKISPQPKADYLYRSIWQKIWLKTTNTTVAPSNKYSNGNLKRSNKLSYWSKFYVWNVSTMENKPNRLLNYNKLYYDRWLHYGYLLKLYKTKILRSVNGSLYVNFNNYVSTAWKYKAKTLKTLHMVLLEKLQGSKILIDFMSLEKSNEKMKFKLKKVYKPPPNLNHVTVPSQ
jgi:hypothetical protein